jgi:hypothetical protein
MRMLALLLISVILPQEQRVPDGPLARLRHGDFPVVSIGFYPDGKRLLSTGKGGRVWDLSSGKVVAELEGVLGHQSYLIQFSPDGKTIVGYQFSQQEICLWDAVTGQGTVSIFPGGRLTGVACSPDARTVFSVSGGILRHDLRDFAAPPQSFADDKGDVLAIAIAGDGLVLASSSSDGSLRLWNPQTRKVVKILETAVPPSRLLRFSPEGAFLFSWGREDRSVSVWDVAQGLRRGKLQFEGEDLRGLDCSRDGRILASLDREGAITLWEVASGRRLTTFEARGKALCMALSRDGSRVAQGLDSGEILVWNMRPAPTSPDPPALEGAWNVLGGDDPSAAWRTVHLLAASGAVSREMLAKKLTESPTPEDLRTLLAELDDATVAVRVRAMDKLEAFLHDPAVRRAVESSPSSEVRERLNELLRNRRTGFLRPGEALRRVRAVWALELQGAGAAGVLENLARGDPASLQATEAASALKRTRPK